MLLIANRQDAPLKTRLKINTFLLNLAESRREGKGLPPPLSHFPCRVVSVLLPHHRNSTRNEAFGALRGEPTHPRARPQPFRRTDRDKRETGDEFQRVEWEGGTRTTALSPYVGSEMPLGRRVIDRTYLLPTLSFPFHH